MTPHMIVFITSGIALVLFITNKVPFLFTCLACMLTMYFTGVCTLEEAFSGFNSSAVWSLIGMSMASSAFRSSGLAGIVGTGLFRVVRKHQKYTGVCLYLTAALLTLLTPGMTVVLMLMPMVDSLVAQSKGNLSRRMCYMPLAIGALLGGNLTLSGSANMLSASGMLEAATGQRFSYLTSMPVASAAVLSGLLFYLTIGPRIMASVLGSEENAALPSAVDTYRPDLPDRLTPKMIKTALILLLTFAMLIRGRYAMPAIGSAAAAILILTGCTTPEEAISSVPWDIIVQVAALIGFASAIDRSGAAARIGNVLLSFAARSDLGPFGLCLMLMLIGQLLTNFMSNNATVGLLVPIAIGCAQRSGTDPLPFVLATVISTNSGYITPLCCPLVSLTLKAGYRFSDYFRINILLNFITFIGTALALRYLYFM